LIIYSTNKLTSCILKYDDFKVTIKLAFSLPYLCLIFLLYSGTRSEGWHGITH